MTPRPLFLMTMSLLHCVQKRHPCGIACQEGCPCGYMPSHLRKRRHHRSPVEEGFCPQTCPSDPLMATMKGVACPPTW